MQSLRLSLMGLLAACWPAVSSADEPPDWVPDEYRQYIVRYVDERPIWRKALNHVDVELGDTGRAFALIAGVSFYPNMTGRERDLAPARVDIEKMASYLSTEPESFNEIVVLAEEAVTHDNLRYFLTHYFPRRLREAPKSRFLFAYSGHGMTDSFDDGFLLSKDAQSLTDSFNAISLNELRVWFQSVVREGHQVLALINACYGSAFHKLNISFGPSDDAIPRREGAHAITAGGAGELTWHSKEFGEGSIFFEAVLKALDGRADKYTDGVVTIDELQTYLREKIRSFTDERQNPRPGDLTKAGSPGGFFFLDRRRQVEKKVVAKLEGKWWQPFGVVPDKKPQIVPPVPVPRDDLPADEKAPGVVQPFVFEKDSRERARFQAQIRELFREIPSQFFFADLVESRPKYKKYHSKDYDVFCNDRQYVEYFEESEIIQYVCTYNKYNVDQYKNVTSDYELDSMLTALNDFVKDDPNWIKYANSQCSNGAQQCISYKNVSDGSFIKFYNVRDEITKNKTALIVGTYLR